MTGCDFTDILYNQNIKHVAIYSFGGNPPQDYPIV